MPDAEVQADSSTATESTDIMAPESTAKTDDEKATPGTEKEEQTSTSESSESSKEGESVSSSEEAKHSEGRNAQKRINQLTAQLRQVERKLAEVSKVKEAEAPKYIEPVKPTQEKFDTWDEYNQALDKYVSDMRDYTAKTAVENDRKTRSEQAARDEQEKTQKAAKDAWDKRAEATKARNPDFDTVTCLEVVQPNPALDAFFVDSPLGPDVLAYLAEHTDEAEKMRDLSPLQTLRAAIAIEQKIEPQIKGIKTKGEPPKPPGYVSGKASSPAKPKNAADVLYG
jgi:hypothetical protein